MNLKVKEKSSMAMEDKKTINEEKAELIANSIMIGVQSSIYHTNVYNTNDRCYNHGDLKRAAMEMAKFKDEVKQNPSWTEEDIRNFESLCEFFTNWSKKHYTAYDRLEAMEKWLFNRFRIFPPRQQEWNENDEERIDSIKDTLRYCNYKSGVVKHKDFEWLEDLKPRIGK